MPTSCWGPLPAQAFFAKKDKKKKKKKESSKVDPNKAIEVLSERGKDVSITAEKAAKQMAEAEPDEWAEQSDEVKQAERLVTGIEIAKLEKPPEVDARAEALATKGAPLPPCVGL